MSYHWLELPLFLLLAALPIDVWWGCQTDIPPYLYPDRLLSWLLDKLGQAWPR